MVHYIHKGKGFFQYNNKTYTLEEGCGFLIFPDILAYYKADEVNPWNYSWVGFNGTKAAYYLKQAGLSVHNPVIYMNQSGDLLNNCILQMIETQEEPKGRDCKLTGLLHLFLASLIRFGNSNSQSSPNNKEQYAKQVIDYVKMNYSGDISIADISRYVGLDRSYLGLLFKERYNMTPQEFLIKFRITRACDLLHNKNMTIGDISRSVGYGDQFAFSKIFRKVKGVSPTEFRNSTRP